MAFHTQVDGLLCDTEFFQEILHLEETIFNIGQLLVQEFQGAFRYPVLYFKIVLQECFSVLIEKDPVLFGHRSREGHIDPAGTLGRNTDDQSVHVIGDHP